jgi:hypothetical protein
MATSPSNVPLTLLRYCTATPTARTRVQLPQHMFTFLLEGEKVRRRARHRAPLAGAAAGGWQLLDE